MIEFGGILFWIIIVGFLVVQSVLLYQETGYASLVLLGMSVLTYFLISDLPNVHWIYLALYPLGAMLWLPCYWYIELTRIASDIKNLIKDNNGSLQKARDNAGSLSKHFTNKHFTTDSISVDIKNPPKSVLFDNAIMFPVSIIITFGDNFIKVAYNMARDFMDKQRLFLSNSINFQFGNKS